MHFFPFLLVVLVYLCLGFKQLESTTLKFNTTDYDHSILKPDNITIHPECQRKCGELLVPYPFGINSNGLNCSINPYFAITCNITTNSSEAFLMDGNVQVYDISNSELRISNSVASRCYDQFGNVTISNYSSISLEPTTYFYSASNVFTVVGCDDFSIIYNAPYRTLPKGCSTTCLSITDVMTENETCSGSGCCQVPINVMQYFSINLNTYYSHTNISSFNECGFAFMGEKGTFKFPGLSNLRDPITFKQRTMDTVPIVLDWAIGDKNCVEAAQDSSSPICYSNSICINETRHGGYRCKCDEGYEGNPYLSPGCRDIDECQQETHGCEQICSNTDGGFTCSCRSGHVIDPNNQKKCIAKSSQVMKFAYATCGGLGVLLVLAATWWLCKVMKRRKIRKLKEKNFERNGGLLLHQQVSSSEGKVDTTKLFTSKELEMATDHYNRDRILGQGGQGTVYKGMLTDGRIVAVKKSKLEDENKQEQFINEVVLLSKINHRNIVKLHGCCLETDIPLLVYEFIPNGTLFEYIHDHNEDFPLTWDIRVRVATEIAGALFYLHSAASIPIYHRDIKSSNILLDVKYRAKMADFGTSKSIALDQTHLTTRVQGTFGYLDPEYYQSSQFTDKSDVYSFGVVLVELLTGQKPILAPRDHNEGRSLATHFILTMEENRIFDILDPRIAKEGRKEEITTFANIAYRCLNLNGRKRPTMKQVAAELESINMSQTLPTAEQLYEEVEYPVTDQLPGPWDLTSTSMSSSTSKSVKVDVEPLIRKY